MSLLLGHGLLEGCELLILDNFGEFVSKSKDMREFIGGLVVEEVSEEVLYFKTVGVWLKNYVLHIPSSCQYQNLFIYI